MAGMIFKTLEFVLILSQMRANTHTHTRTQNLQPVTVTGNTCDRFNLALLHTER